jgi:hypothetical protein
MTENQLHDAAHPEVGHEASDASLAGVAGFAAALTVATLVVLALLWLLLGFLTTRPTAVPGSPSVLAPRERGHWPPEPRLEGLPVPGGAPVPGRPAEYGWVDRNAGIVRVPIDEAMKIVAEKFSSSPDGRGGNPSSPKKP